ncbi:MAG: hypothetical protein H7301_10520 [Cryobacterium sp.]|nr:hypothetical protein [Oligoflexia bacterium]
MQIRFFKTVSRFVPILCLFIWMNPSEAAKKPDACPAFFSPVQVEDLPPELYQLLKAKSFQSEVLAYRKDKAFKIFADEIVDAVKNPYAGLSASQIAAKLSLAAESESGTKLVPLIRDGKYSLAAKVVPTGEGHTEIFFTVSSIEVPIGSALLDWQAIQMAILLRLFKEVDTQSLSRVTVAWKFVLGSKQADLVAENAMNRFGFETLEGPPTARCQFMKKAMVILSSVTLGAGGGAALFGGVALVASDASIRPEKQIIAALGTGAVIGAASATFIAFKRTCGTTRGVNPKVVRIFQRLSEAESPSFQ